jgi:hypothetical protein
MLIMLSLLSAYSQETGRKKKKGSGTERVREWDKVGELKMSGKAAEEVEKETRRKEEKGKK